MKKYVVYYRSWPRKTPSHVELSSQKREIERFVSYNQGQIIATYTEKEAKHTQRPELAKAIEHTLRSDAALVIGHLGRLARNIPVTRLLQETKVDFVCCDAPTINRLTIHIMEVMAEDESRRLGDRSKKALAKAKARGVKLGSADPRLWKGREHLRGTKKAIAAAAVKKRIKTRNTYSFLLEEIKTRRTRGDTLPEIIEWLNQQGHTTTAGMPFTQTALWRIIDRYLGKEYLGNNLRKRKAAV